MTNCLLVYDLDIILLFNKNLHRLDPSKDPTCPKCRLAEQDLNHWLTSVWKPQKVLRVACYSTWGCGGVRKEDLDQP